MDGSIVCSVVLYQIKEFYLLIESEREENKRRYEREMRREEKEEKRKRKGRAINLRTRCLSTRRTIDHGTAW
jgi:hypothetical protein